MVNILKKYLIPKHAYLGKGYKFWINVAVAASAFFLMTKIYLLVVMISLVFLTVVITKPVWNVLNTLIFPIEFGIPFYISYFTRASLFTYLLKKPLVNPGDDKNSR